MGTKSDNFTLLLVITVSNAVGYIDSQYNLNIYSKNGQSENNKKV